MLMLFLLFNELFIMCSTRREYSFSMLSRNDDEKNNDNNDDDNDNDENNEKKQKKQRNVNEIDKKS